MYFLFKKLIIFDFLANFWFPVGHVGGHVGGHVVDTFESIIIRDTFERISWTSTLTRLSKFLDISRILSHQISGFATSIYTFRTYPVLIGPDMFMDTFTWLLRTRPVDFLGHVRDTCANTIF